VSSRRNQPDRRNLLLSAEICWFRAAAWTRNLSDPATAMPVPAGGFVRRVAHTPHYDGVIPNAKEPAVIALFGIAPVDLKLVDPHRPAWRRL
jgi:hypothetical protein